MCRRAGPPQNPHVGYVRFKNVLVVAVQDAEQSKLLDFICNTQCV